jgi:predicted O-methyltransferase YrrM
MRKSIHFVYKFLSNLIQTINSIWYKLDKIDDVLPKFSQNGYKIQWRQKILPSFTNFQNNSTTSLSLRKWFYELLSQEIDFEIETELRQRVTDLEDSKYLDIYPGVYYKIMCVLLASLRPNLSIEIGTLRGTGTTCISHYSKKTLTFDILPVSFFTGIDSFSDNKSITQILADIADDKEYSKYEDLFCTADFIFLDGPKDGKFEKKVIQKIIQSMKSSCVLLIDDIGFNNMSELWHEISFDKLDFTSFGHWSGSGLVVKDAELLLKKVNQI